MSWSIDIISCITDRFVELTATEKRIAQFILDDVAAAAELPIAEMARLTHTSQARSPALPGRSAAKTSAS